MMSLKEVGEWWGELQEDFRRLRQNHQDYLREFYGPSAEKQMKSAEFLVYKQHLIRYLEDFVQDLQSSAAQIGALLESFSEEQVHRILTLVHKSALEVPRPRWGPGLFLAAGTLAAGAGRVEFADGVVYRERFHG